jgi:chromosome partitioning protein
VAKVVAILGRKGGAGKTSLAHALGHGLGSLPTPVMAAVVTTDELTPVPPRTGRRYLPVAGHTGELFQRNVRALLDRDDVVLVIDGAASRPAADQAAAKMADLVLVPFTPAEQDVAVVLKDLEAYPKAVAVPNRWPTHPKVRERADAYLARIPAARRFSPVPAVPKLAEILNGETYPRVASDLAASCRAFAMEVLSRLRLSPIDLIDAGKVPGIYSPEKS